VRLVWQKVRNVEKDALRNLVDSLRREIGSGVVVVGSEFSDKVQIAAGVTPDLTGRVSAGRLMKELAPVVGGKGGGRVDFAEAGGKDIAKIDDLAKSAQTALASLIAAAPSVSETPQK
jgi:alanyl-tRNA synthetase